MQTFKNLDDIQKNEVTNYDDETGVLKFTHCHKKYPLHNLSKKELKEFVNFAQRIEKMKWKDIKINKGLCYEKLHNFNLPTNISEDVIAYSMRVSKKFRIIGFKENQYFYIIWFTNNHDET